MKLGGDANSIPSQPKPNICWSAEVFGLQRWIFGQHATPNVAEDFSYVPLSILFSTLSLIEDFLSPKERIHTHWVFSEGLDLTAVQQTHRQLMIINLTLSVVSVKTVFPFCFLSGMTLVIPQILPKCWEGRQNSSGCLKASILKNCYIQQFYKDSSSLSCH